MKMSLSNWASPHPQSPPVRLRWGRRPGGSRWSPCWSPALPLASSWPRAAPADWSDRRHSSQTRQRGRETWTSHYTIWKNTEFFKWQLSCVNAKLCQHWRKQCRVKTWLISGCQKSHQQPTFSHSRKAHRCYCLTGLEVQVPGCCSVDVSSDVLLICSESSFTRQGLTMGSPPAPLLLVYCHHWKAPSYWFKTGSCVIH